MGVRLIDMPGALTRRKQVEFFEDFQWYISPHMWTSVLTDSGTAAVGDAVNGIVTLTPSDCSVADNDQTWIKTTNEVLLWAAGRTGLAEALIQFTEAATNAANVFFGVADAVAADLLLDNGGGVKTTMSGAGIYKVDGSTAWKCISSKSTTQTISTSTETAGGSSYQALRIEWKPVSTTDLEVAFFVNDKQLIDSTSLKPIKHVVTYTSATEMQVGAGVKNGSANQQTLLIDYICWAQKRMAA